MKIGIDCHNLEGQRTGVGRYLWNLLKEWQKNIAIQDAHDREHLVEFYLYFKNEIPQDVYELVSKATSPPPALGGGGASWTLKLLGRNSNALFKHWLLPRAAMRDSVDVIFCPDYILPFDSPLAHFVRFGWFDFAHHKSLLLDINPRMKTAVAIHDIIYEARPNEYSWPSRSDKILLKWASKQSAKKADVIFAPSEFTKNEILKYYKINPEKVVVTPLAPDSIFQKIENLSSPLSAEGGEGARSAWNSISKKYNITHKKYIFFIGSIFNRRFLPQEMKGFAIFAKNHSEFNFLIIGNNRTKPYQDISALIVKANQELGCEAIVWRKFASDEELVYLYNGAFVTIWLSSYEGFGLPVLESMACGTPVITSRSGSLSEVAGDAALHIDNPKDPQEIADALGHLTRDRGYYDSLVEKGLSQAQKFSWQKTARETIEKIMLL
jgi:glycosyltransferase involved in cell wall biosynthesis